MPCLLRKPKLKSMRRSFGGWQELWTADGERLIAQAEVACACIGAVDFKLTPCPPDLAQRLVTPMAAGERENRN